MRSLRTVATMLLVLMTVPAVRAEQKSTNCVTPSVRCTAAYAGPVGAACACQTPRGWVNGRLG